MRTGYAKVERIELKENKYKFKNKNRNMARNKKGGRGKEGGRKGIELHGGRWIFKVYFCRNLTIHIPEYFKHPDRINPEPLLPVKKSVKNIKREESA